MKRPAEDDLFELALTGEFCHVLTAYHLDFSDDFLIWKTVVHQRLRDFQRVNLSEEDGWTSLVKVTRIGMERRAEVIEPIAQESTPFEPHPAYEKPSPDTERATPRESPGRISCRKAILMTKPLIISTNKPLPFDDLSPLEFERMCLWLVEREGYQCAEHLGASGSERGRDIIAYQPTSSGDQLWYFQCKRTGRAGYKTLAREVDKIVALVTTQPKLEPTGVVFMTSCTLSNMTRGKIRADCEEQGWKVEFWARTEMDMRVKKHPDIVEEFFYARAPQDPTPSTGFLPAWLVEHSTPGGTLSPGSRVYIRRSIDDILENSLLQSGNIIVIRGNVEMGKSSLLASGLAYVEKNGRQIIRIDFQGVKALPDSERAGDLFRNIAMRICSSSDRRLDAELVMRIWDTLGPQNNLLNFVKDYVLIRFDEPIVLAMDEVNLILNTPFGNDFRGLLRTWQHDIATNKNIWDKLTIVIVFSTEPYLLADDIKPLQWTIGTKIEVRDFNQEEIRQLNHRYGSPLSLGELQDMTELLGGHPYLTHIALHEIVEGELNSWQALAELAVDDEYSPFKDHLIRRYDLIRKRPELEAALRQIVHDQTCSDQESFLRLQAAGLARRKGREHHCRYKLYEHYFSDRL